MSPSRTPWRERRERAQRRALRQLMKDVEAAAKQHLREAIAEGLLPGRIEADGTVVIEEDQ